MRSRPTLRAVYGWTAVDWNARSEQTIPAGSLCVVLSVDGATLTVRPDTATAAV